jgi:hypothetical protein
MGLLPGRVRDCAARSGPVLPGSGRFDCADGRAWHVQRPYGVCWRRSHLGLLAQGYSKRAGQLLCSLCLSADPEVSMCSGIPKLVWAGILVGICLTSSSDTHPYIHSRKEHRAPVQCACVVPSGEKGGGFSRRMLLIRPGRAPTDTGQAASGGYPAIATRRAETNLSLSSHTAGSNMLPCGDCLAPNYITKSAIQGSRLWPRLAHDLHNRMVGENYAAETMSPRCTRANPFLLKQISQRRLWMDR